MCRPMAPLPPPAVPPPAQSAEERPTRPGRRWKRKWRRRRWQWRIVLWKDGAVLITSSRRDGARTFINRPHQARHMLRPVLNGRHRHWRSSTHLQIARLIGRNITEPETRIEPKWVIITAENLGQWRLNEAVNQPVLLCLSWMCDGSTGLKAFIGRLYNIFFPTRRTNR